MTPTQARIIAALESGPASMEIIRAYYMKPILRTLQKIQSHACTPDAIVYINQILRRICEFDNRSPDDPILEVLFALYDALVVDNLWTAYSETQYKTAERILVRVIEEPINPRNIENAIINLDKAGFDVLPFSFSDKEIERDGKIYLELTGGEG